MLPKEIHRRASQGDRSAISQVVEYNEGLVFSTVNSMCFHLDIEETEDAYQEGRLALHKAATCYNVDRGTRFSTYAVRTIQRRVHRAIGDTVDPVHLRVPSYMRDTLRKYKRAFREAVDENGVEPSEEYMMAAVGHVYGDRKPITREKIRKVHSLMLALDEGCLSLQHEEGCRSRGWAARDFEGGYESVEMADLCERLCGQLKENMVGCYDSCSSCENKLGCPYVIFLLYHAPDMEPAASVVNRWGDEGWRGTKKDIASMLGIDQEQVDNALADSRSAIAEIREVFEGADTLPQISA